MRRKPPKSPGVAAPDLAATSGWVALRQRKVVQWSLAYVAAATALLQLMVLVAEQFAWPPVVGRTAIVALACGLPIAIVLAWYHGERGQQHVTGGELLWLSLLLGLAAALLWWLQDPESAGREAPIAAQKAVAPAAARTSRIAVLPLANLSPDPANAYFAEGLHDELLTALTKLGDIEVVSRTTMLSFRGGNRSVRQIAEELGASHVLEGTVRREGDQVRMTLKLIEPRGDRQLWAESYTREVESTLALQAEVAAAVAGELGIHVMHPARAEAALRIDSDALGYYLQARQLVDGETSDSRRRRLALLDRALEIAPDFGVARAERCVAMAHLHWFAEATDLQPRAEADLAQAWRLAPDEPITHAAQAYLHYYFENDFAAAQAVVAAARQRWPLAADLAYLDALLARRTGNFEQSLPLFELAARLDPRNETYQWERMQALVHIRRDYRAAHGVANVLVAIKSSPDNRGARVWTRYLATGDHDALVASLARTADEFDAAGDTLRALLARLLVATEQGDASAVERLLGQWPRTDFEWSGARREPLAVARTYWALRRGDEAAASRHYEEAVRVHRQRLAGSRAPAWIRMQLATLHAAMQRHDLAQPEFAQALALAHATPDRVLAAEVYNDAVAYHAWRGDQAGALAWLRRRLDEPLGLHAAEVVDNPLLHWRLGDDPGFQALRRQVRQDLAAAARQWPATHRRP